MSEVAPTTLAGITTNNCASACSAFGCVITGSVCAHPNKGGVQYADKKPDILARYADACKILGVVNKHEIPT